MKLHLPKLLLVALLSCSMAQAYSEGETILVGNGELIEESKQDFPNATLTQTGGKVSYGTLTSSGTESQINQSGGSLTINSSRVETEGQLVYNQKSNQPDNIPVMSIALFSNYTGVYNGKHIINQEGYGEIKISTSYVCPEFVINQSGKGEGKIEIDQMMGKFENCSINQSNPDATITIGTGALQPSECKIKDISVAGTVEIKNTNLTINKLELNGGTLTVGSGNHSTPLTLSEQLYIASANNGNVAPIILKSNNKLFFGENLSVSIGLGADFASSSLKIALVSCALEGKLPDYLDNAAKAEKITLDSVVWTASNLEWLQEKDVLYVTGDLTQNDEVVIDKETEVSESITDKGDEAVTLTVNADTTLSSGKNTYSGGTVINGATLKLEEGATVGTGDVWLTSTEDGCGVFDMGGNDLTNKLIVTGCILRNAQNYQGDMEVSHELEIEGVATAKKVTLKGEGTLVRDAQLGGSLSADALDVQTTGDATLDIDLAINDSGEITLRDGKVLSVKGSLTLGNGVDVVLTDGDYGVGDKLLSSTGTLTMGDVTLVYNDSTVELELQGNSLVLVSKFKQDKADAVAQGNWGIASASRAFVNTVRGQHSNTGCIANGRGTVWAAAFGAYNDMDGADINVKGAAVGVDTKVGSCSTVGLAVGYADGEVSPTGLRDVDQEGTYVALYGEHGLKKLSSTSCLSLDWVAAYGNTESEWNGMDWEQDSLQLNTRLNWNKKVTDRLCMSVFGGLEYFASESDTVNGVKTGSIQNLRGEIGVGARYVAWGTPGAAASYDEKGAMVAAAQPGCEKLVLHGEIRYMNDMVRSNPVIRMNGLSGDGENPGRQGMGIEAGATYRISERWSASANYGFNTMEDSKEHRVNVGASYTF